MKKLSLLMAAALLCFACNNTKDAITVNISNTLHMERAGEMVEVSMDEVVKQLNLADTAQIVVLDADGQQVPYQITHNDKLIFAVSVASKGEAVYTIQTGTPNAFNLVACGRHYPERMDDIAWENDLVAFRTYGPALQNTGERAFGYDVWTKYNTSEPVVEARYASELNPEVKAKIAELKATDPEAANKLYQSVSYHVDHGNGLDCYKVGPTLGGGATALMADGELIYPYCYASYDILDNGPLRFSVKLTYHPAAVKGDSAVVETRTITLDAGSYLNKTVLSYSNLSQETLLATGIVLHEPNGEVTADAANGYISYVDPTDNVNNNNGKIFVGAAFPAEVKEAKSVLFDEKEKNELRGGADGHVLAISQYQPNAEFVYYWGSAWDKAEIKTAEAWNEYLASYAQKLRNPLLVTMK